MNKRVGLGLLMLVGQFLATFKEFSQRQKADSFNRDDVLRKMQGSGGSK